MARQHLNIILASILVFTVETVHSQIQVSQTPDPQASNFPYIRSIPIVKLPENKTTLVEQQGTINVVDQRSLNRVNNQAYLARVNTGRVYNPRPNNIQHNVPPRFVSMSSSRQMGDLQRPMIQSASGINETTQIIDGSSQTPNCMYDKRYLADLDECLARKPYPTIGLPAFKNEDLVMQRALDDKYGCQFILANGLFQNYQINRYNIESDTQCLDNSRVRLNLDFNNVTLNYLWTLRCLNRADQMLEDATHNGMTNLEGDDFQTSTSDSSPRQHTDENQSICVGSSQNFGFASLQLSALKAQIDLATDIYKNWRVINADLAMINPPAASSYARQMNPEAVINQSGTNIRDFVFESLDGDELNWRYLHLYKNWSRNKMHSNFVDQYRRFLWISLQNCLSESTNRLPKKPIEIFANNNVV